jgi:hypothetical protein
MVGGAISGSRVYFQIQKLWLCKMKNSNKMGEKSGKNGGWLVMMLEVLFLDPRCISKYGGGSYAKMKNTDKIEEKSEKIGDGW